MIALEAVDGTSDTRCRARGHVGERDDNEAPISLTRFGRAHSNEIVPDLPPDVDRIPIERTRAGPRPAGADAVPFLGPVPGRPYVLVAAAHEGVGVMTSLATGLWIAEQMEGRAPSIPLEPYRPERVGPTPGRDPAPGGTPSG